MVCNILLQLAVKNALRYFPEEKHEELASEFAYELREYGHIYMYCLRPTIRMKYVKNPLYQTVSLLL